MTRQLFLLNFIIIFQTSATSAMYKVTPLFRMQITQALLITHIRNFQHHLTYKTPQGVIIAEHWDGSETHTYPDGTVIHQFPKKPTNQPTPKKNELYLQEQIQKLKR